jgi:outer membrane protein insertion porin family
MIGRVALWTVAVVLALGPSVAIAAPPVVTGIDLVSPHRLPEERVRGAIGDLAGKPLARAAVRASLERLWALGLFEAISVDEVPDAAGVRLAYRMTRRPLVRSLRWEGETGLDLADVAASAGLAIGDEASPDTLDRMRRSLIARYRREGFLGAKVVARADEVGETNERDVTVTLDAGERARLGDVDFVGEPGLTAPELAKLSRLREGAAYRDLLVRDGARAIEDHLRAEGYYEARATPREPRWYPETNRVDLEVEVRRGPRFQVEFRGRSALSEKTLRSQLTFAHAGRADEFEEQASARQIEAAYREQGYHFAQVTAVPPTGDGGHVLGFEIEEGPRVRVESVTFTGNLTEPDAKLAKLIETAPPGLFRRGLFRAEALDRDVRVLLAHLRAQGYPDATVGPTEIAFSEDRTQVRVTIPVTEGPRLRVASVTVQGASVVTQAQLVAASVLKPGDAWDAERARAGQRAMERLYAGHAHHGATVALESRRGDAGVELTYRVEEGAPTRIGRILVRGLALTRESVIRRDLPFREGDLLSTERLLEGQRRLGELPAFASVSIDPLRPPPAPFADVEVSIRERKPWHLDFGVGYGTEDGGRGFVEIGHDNVFGTAASVSLRQRVSAGGQSIGFAQRTDALGRIPWILGTPWWGEVNPFQGSAERIGYDVAEVGLRLGAHRDLFPGWVKGLRGELRYRIESIRYSNVDPTLAEADVTEGTEIVSSVSPILTLDRRDEPLDPRRGSFHRVSVEVGSGVIGSDIDFLKTRLETRWFLPWLAPVTIVVAARLGLAEPYAGSPALAIQDRFYAGGASTVRGYREDRIGPLDSKGNPVGGNGLAIFNLETRFPIWRWLGGTVFVDTGAVTPRVEDLWSGPFHTGVGGGLRIKTPVGPVRVDVGYALTPIPGESRAQVHVTVGNPF